MLRHRAGRGPAIAGEQSSDNCQVLVGFAGQASEVVPRPGVGPRYIAKRSKQGLQPSQFAGQKRIVARGRDRIVQAAIDGPSPLDVFGVGMFRPLGKLLQVGGQLFQCLQVDPPTGPADGFAFENAADLADLADFLGGHLADNRAAIGQQVNDPTAGQGDQRLANWRMTDAKPLG